VLRRFSYIIVVSEANGAREAASVRASEATQDLPQGGILQGGLKSTSAYKYPERICQ